ncbi:MAG: NAD+ synthase [Candidatus Marinimicrobia bacterium]|nr:NAD+ synthase [Candidatus Neomarinimicrobiota bacterium]
MTPPLKIALAQINPTVGAIDANAQLIRQIMSSVGDDVDLLIFPECALPGYPAQDLLLNPRFIADTQSALQSLAAGTGPTAVIVGTVREEEGHLYNSAALLQNGAVAGYRDKTLLPTYDVFDEARYFTPASDNRPLPVDLPSGKRIVLGLHICEDMWDDRYAAQVCRQLTEAGAELLVNISASPFRDGIAQERHAIMIQKAADGNVPYLYCNLVGGQDELVFDGRSALVSPDGRVVKQAAAFDSGLLHITLPDDLAGSGQVQPPQREVDLMAAIELGIADYFGKTGHARAIIGLSGGIDSSLVAALAAAALGPAHVTGVIMPSVYNAAASAEDAAKVAGALGIEALQLPIESLRLETMQQLAPHFDGSRPGVAEENLQARLRGLLLMALANKRGALVLSTGNKTEIALGYATLYGDMAGALGPIGDLTKPDVYALARAVNERAGKPVIPDSVLTKTPSAELRENQTDPFDYDHIAPLVEQLISDPDSAQRLIAQGYDRKEITSLSKMITAAEYKRRQAALTIRVTGKAFGAGRRYPVVNAYE